MILCIQSTKMYVKLKVFLYEDFFPWHGGYKSRRREKPRLGLV